MARGEGWRTVRLGEIAEESRERFAPSNAEERPYIGLEHLESNTGRIAAVGSSRDVTSAKTVFRAGDTLFGKLRPYLRKVARPNFDGVCSTDILAIRPRPGTIPEFLSALLASEPVIQAAVGTAAGTKMPRTSWRQLSQVVVPHPPVHEQQKIAEIIGSVEEAIQATRAVIEQTRKVKQGILQELLTRGIGHTRFKQTEIGEVPEGWEVLPLKKVAEVRTGVAKGRRNFTDPVRVPYLRVANVQDGYIDLSEVKEIDIERSDLERYMLRSGDVLLTEGGDYDKLGRGDVWRGQIEPCVHQNHVFSVRCDERAILPEFLAILASSEYGRRYFLGCAKQTTNLASINSTQLKAFPVALPPTDEQREITKRLDAVASGVREGVTMINSLRCIKGGLIWHLLTSRIRGVDNRPGGAAL